MGEGGRQRGAGTSYSLTNSRVAAAGRADKGGRARNDEEQKQGWLRPTRKGAGASSTAGQAPRGLRPTQEGRSTGHNDEAGRRPSRCGRQQLAVCRCECLPPPRPARHPARPAHPRTTKTGTKVPSGRAAPEATSAAARRGCRAHSTRKAWLSRATGRTPATVHAWMRRRGAATACRRARALLRPSRGGAPPGHRSLDRLPDPPALHNLSVDHEGADCSVGASAKRAAERFAGADAQKAAARGCKGACPPSPPPPSPPPPPLPRVAPRTASHASRSRALRSAQQGAHVG